MATVRRLGIATWLTFALCSRMAGAASPGLGVAQPANTAGQADEARRENADRHLLLARSETFLQLFRRALLPGANGTLVTTETALPLHQFLFVQARDLDLPWQKDGLDLDFSAWGRLWPGQSDVERPFDGDLQTASMRYRTGPAWVRLGRQHAAGGAARFVRFDGVAAGAEHVSGVFAAAYAGYSVLPRWNERSGYHHLGSGEGEFSKYAVEPLHRAEHWLAGGHAGYRSQRFGGSASLHEQREAGGLERRNLGVDLTGRLHERASLGGSALFELDSRRLATLRLWADLMPISNVDLGLEFLRAKPSLLLSRMSVLSVFSSDAYDEIGGTLSFPVRSFLSFESNAYATLYPNARSGGRGEAALRLVADETHRTTVRVAYARVTAPENGYHSLRSSFSRKLSARFATTLEAYGYFYDTNVSGFSTSSVYAASVSYRALERLEFLWGGSLARSPYAALDAQTLLRAVWDLDASAGVAR